MSGHFAASPPALAELPRERLLVEASLWSADLTALAAEVGRVAPCADMLHVDVADGNFVDQLLFFPDLVAALRPRTALPIHAHLMVERPGPVAEAFGRAGADLITVHAETGESGLEAVAEIRQRGQTAGVALRAESDPQLLAAFLDWVDVVLMIGTPLGTSGTEMSVNAPARIGAVRELLERHERGEVRVIADGGIRRHSVGPLYESGADGVVAGSLLFGSEDMAATSKWLRAHCATASGGGPA